MVESIKERQIQSQIICSETCIQPDATCETPFLSRRYTEVDFPFMQVWLLSIQRMGKKGSHHESWRKTKLISTYLIENVTDKVKGTAQSEMNACAHEP